MQVDKQADPWIKVVDEEPMAMIGLRDFCFPCRVEGADYVQICFVNNPSRNQIISLHV